MWTDDGLFEIVDLVLVLDGDDGDVLVWVVVGEGETFDIVLGDGVGKAVSEGGGEGSEAREDGRSERGSFF